MTEQLLKEQNELLKQLVKNTSPKDSQQIIVRSTKTDFDTIYKEPIELSNEKEYEIALVDLETYYSFPNISTHNNVIEYEIIKEYSAGHGGFETEFEVNHGMRLKPYFFQHASMFPNDFNYLVD